MKPLSPNNRFYNLLIPIVLIMTLISLIYRILQVEFNLLLFFVLFGGLCFLIFWLFKALENKNIFYDDNFIYLRNPKTEEKVSLMNVRELKLTLSDIKFMGIKFLEYRIEYENELNNLDTIHFWITLGSNKLDEFENTLKSINPNVKAKHWATSFDS